jgi:hypothetical protein
MDIQVVVKEILPDVQYQSKKDGSVHNRHQFVAETMGQYPRKMKFDVMSDETWGKMSLQVGVMYNVGFDADSREFNGKWYTSLTAWKAFRGDCQSTAQVPQQPAQPQQTPIPNAEPNAAPQPQAQPQNEENDLPF